MAYFVHGRGRGHASRALAVVRSLVEDGHEVTMHAGGDALDLLDAPHALPPSVQRVPIAVVRPGAGAIGGWTSRLRDGWIIAPGAMIHPWVISDGDQPSLLLARARGARTIAIGHDLVFSFGVVPRSLPQLALAVQRANSAVTHLAEARVAVHFLPFETRDRRTVAARPDFDDLAGALGDDGSVLAYFRDPNGRAVVEHARAAGARVIWFGQERPLERRAFVEALRTCRAVIASAGSNVLAECVHLAKPVLALHARTDTEQSLNAGAIAAAGVGMGARVDTVDRRTIETFLGRAAARDFAHVDLAAALPSVSEVVLNVVRGTTGSIATRAA